MQLQCLNGLWRLYIPHSSYKTFVTRIPPPTPSMLYIPHSSYKTYSHCQKPVSQGSLYIPHSSYKTIECLSFTTGETVFTSHIVHIKRWVYRETTSALSKLYIPHSSYKTLSKFFAFAPLEHLYIPHSSYKTSSIGVETTATPSFTSHIVHIKLQLQTQSKQPNQPLHPT